MCSGRTALLRKSFTAVVRLELTTPATVNSIGQEPWNNKTDAVLLVMQALLPSAAVLMLLGLFGAALSENQVLGTLALLQGIGGIETGGGYSVNHLDIAPAHAGVVQGVKNTFGQGTGWMAPIVLGLMTPVRLPIASCTNFVLCSTSFGIDLSALAVPGSWWAAVVPRGMGSQRSNRSTVGVAGRDGCKLGEGVCDGGRDRLARGYCVRAARARRAAVVGLIALVSPQL